MSELVNHLEKTNSQGAENKAGINSREKPAVLDVIALRGKLVSFKESIIRAYPETAPVDVFTLKKELDTLLAKLDSLTEENLEEYLQPLYDASLRVDGALSRLADEIYKEVTPLLLLSKK